MKVTESILQSIKDTLSWNVVKIALIASIPLALLWIWVAYLFWSPVVAVASKVIGWIPFSILQANGAFLVGGFVWFLAILITFALIISVFNIAIFRFIKPQKYQYFSILLLLFIALGWTLFALLKWDFVYSEVRIVLNWFPFHTLRVGVALMLAALFFYNLFTVSLALVVLVIRKPFLHELQERDYPDIMPIEGVKKRKFFTIALRDMVTFWVLMLLFSPLFFVPFFNIGLQVLFWAWLIKESYFLSAATLYAMDDEVEELRKHNFVLWSIAFISSMLILVPVINILAPFFAQIVYFHWVMLNRPEMLKQENL